MLYKLCYDINCTNSNRLDLVSKGFDLKDSNLVFWIVLSILHPLKAKTSCLPVSYWKYYVTQVLTCRKKRRTLTPGWEKNFKTTLRNSRTCFVINFKYCWKVLAFFPVEIENRSLLSGVFPTPYLHAWRPSIWLQRWRLSPFLVHWSWLDTLAAILNIAKTVSKCRLSLSLFVSICGLLICLSGYWYV
jgi:hypothetical protein